MVQVSDYGFPPDDVASRAGGVEQQSVGPRLSTPEGNTENVGGESENTNYLLSYIAPERWNQSSSCCANQVPSVTVTTVCGLKTPPDSLQYKCAALTLDMPRLHTTTSNYHSAPTRMVR